MRVRVAIKDKGTGNFYANEVKRINIEKEQDTERFARRAESVMRYMIENSCDGGTGKLANSDGWNAEPIPNGWGVGDIDYLNTNNKNWRHINYGSIEIGANWDHYLPKGYWSNGRWVESDNGYSGIKPKTPIAPHNYIEKCLAQMEIETPKLLKGIN